MQSKSQVRSNRIKQLRSTGLSIPKIAKRLKCAKSIVSYHCKNVKLSDEQVVTLKNNSTTTSKYASAINKLNWDRAKAKSSNEADKEFKELSKNPDFMLFLGLYWGEGNKRGSTIGITNNDPGVILISLKWFKYFSPNSNFETIIKCYPEQDQNKCAKYWSDILKLPIKTMPKPWLGKHRKIYSKRGLCVLRFNNWKFRTKLLRWLELLGSHAMWAEV